VAGKARKLERANFTIYIAGQAGIVNLPGEVDCQAEEKAQANVYGRECSAGRLMNIVDVDMNVYDHPKISCWSTELSLYITMAVNG
jgi:hypothetical protein